MTSVSQGQAGELHAELLRLDLRLRLTVEAARRELVERALDPFRGLCISEEEVDRLLSTTPEPELARRILEQPAAEIAPRLDRVARLFRLDTFEQEALLICLAPELDLRYERLYAYLQDDVTRRRPTVDLILRLLTSSLEGRVAARRALGPSGRLYREGLLALSDDAAARWPLLSRPLRVDERIAEYLLGSDLPDERIASFCELYRPGGVATELTLPDQVGPGLARLLAGGGKAAERGPVVYLQGAPGTAKLATARAACAAAGRALLVLDVPALLAAASPASGIVLAVHEASLQDAVLGLDGVDALLAEDGEPAVAGKLVRRLLAQREGATLLLGEQRWEPSAWLPDILALRIELAAPGIGTRMPLWRGQLDGWVNAVDVADLAARYRLDGDAIKSVAAAARGRAAWRGDGRVEAADVHAAARALAAPPLDGLARRLDPRYGWEDIVLPADGLVQLQELCARGRHHGVVLEQWGFGRKHVRRRGLSALFAGPPGTGKTMAAEIVAGDLGLDVYRIDLSAVVSKYIGETEKNLERIFRAADQGDAVLLFDEADALFGKRSEVRDAHDRYANVEIAYLLQRLEAYEGLAILTTNMRGNIDEAFLRRLDCVLEFPLPEEAERLAIWRRSLPAEAPVAADVDLPFLARKFKLAGGHIRNVAVTAAFLAATSGDYITMRHLVRAIRREYQKLGKLVAEADFEHYFGLLKDLVLDGQTLRQPVGGTPAVASGAQGYAPRIS